MLSLLAGTRRGVFHAIHERVPNLCRIFLLLADGRSRVRLLAYDVYTGRCNSFLGLSGAHPVVRPSYVQPPDMPWCLVAQNQN